MPGGYIAQCFDAATRGARGRPGRESSAVLFALLSARPRDNLRAGNSGCSVKKELRTKLRSVLAGTPHERIVEKSRLAALRLFNEPEYRRAEILMVYLPLQQEADATPIALQAWRDRKRVLAPRISWESHQMIPVEIRDLDEDVAETSFGIRQPIEGPPIPMRLIDLVIVPGLAFDPYGNRLGRGRGFYDRFLAKPDFRGIPCGFALEEQFVSNIPAGPHDQKVRLLVTDAAVRRFDP